MGDYYLDEEITLHYLYLDYDNLPETDHRYWFIVDNNVGEKYSGTLDWVVENADLLANYDVNVRARNFQMRIYLYDPSMK